MSHKSPWFETAPDPSASELSRADWIAIAWKALRESGPSALTVEHLTKGRNAESFHSQFRGIGVLALDLARYWHDAEGEVLTLIAGSGNTPIERMWSVLGLTGGDDPLLERGVRALAADYQELANVVRTADDRREAILTGLLAEAYDLESDEARNYARLFQALHIATLSREPDEIVDYVSGPARALNSLLEGTFPSR